MNGIERLHRKASPLHSLRGEVLAVTTLQAKVVVPNGF